MSHVFMADYSLVRSAIAKIGDFSLYFPCLQGNLWADWLALDWAHSQSLPLNIR